VLSVGTRSRRALESAERRWEDPAGIVATVLKARVITMSALVGAAISGDEDSAAVVMLPQITVAAKTPACRAIRIISLSFVCAASDFSVGVNCPLRQMFRNSLGLPDVYA
jgi:hypothetical protein